ncbi:MAG: (Fe-S)-binding protein [Tepidisphaeraceae bacterium]
MNSTPTTLPGLDCGLCGFRHCSELADSLSQRPEMIRRCVHLKNQTAAPPAKPVRLPVLQQSSPAAETDWLDSLGRPFDFFLEKFPEEPGPREIILPHNPILTREMDICPGDVLIGRPLGMSCGCPITHCGIATEVDRRTGVINWCVTGPLRPRQNGFKDLGYYIAEGYEGLVTESRSELRIGARYFFQPRLCMLQWRHSGLINYLNRTPQGMQIRIEGLWIG